MGAAPALPVPDGMASCRALVAYDERTRTSITGLKNRDHRALVTQLADGLAVLVPDEPGMVITWAPTSGPRRRGRGYDQAELLARAVARRRGLPVRRLLVRRPGAPQAGQRAAGRWSHPGFAARRRTPEVVLLVDDVATTGATLAAATAALHRAGTRVVHGLVVARAPARATRWEGV
jgi:predicted amidophosphoribosyltransferase